MAKTQRIVLIRIKRLVTISMPLPFETEAIDNPAEQ